MSKVNEHDVKTVLGALWAKSEPLTVEEIQERFKWEYDYLEACLEHLVENDEEVTKTGEGYYHEIRE